jgi:hypothetical protein
MNEDLPCRSICMYVHTCIYTYIHAYKNVKSLQVKYPLFLSDFNETRISQRIFEYAQLSNFMKICPVGTELFCADRQMEKMQLIVAFHNFANTPKNC